MPVCPNAIPHPSHPRPQFYRPDWLNCNGLWDFALDGEHFDRTILVPFAPESALSGIGHRDFIEHCAYRRSLEIPTAWKGKRVFLHFEAVDYSAKVFFDDVLCGFHEGGSTPFAVELPADCAGRTVECRVEVEDKLRSGVQPGGKQSPMVDSIGCFYTRVTGIWQTVWLEAVNDAFLSSCRVSGDPESGMASFTPKFLDTHSDDIFKAMILENGTSIAEASGPTASQKCFTIKLENPKIWSPESPFLYDVRLELWRNGACIDRVESVCAFRSVCCKNGTLLLNGKPRYLRFVLDQGFWPDGIWTPPDEEALVNDIRLAKSFGFNGARLHQKVFGERLLDFADRNGFLLWAEFPSWSLDLHLPEAKFNFIREWTDFVSLSANHPSIIAWTPLNETFLFPTPENLKASFPDKTVHQQYQDFVRTVAAITRGLDSTRPVLDSSGWYHVDTDLWSSHLYRPNAVALNADLADGKVFVHVPDYECRWQGQPYFIDEWGGFQYIDGHVPDEASWGYGNKITDEETYLNRISEQLDILLASPQVAGYCYTQLVDIEQEQNGLADCHRIPKVPTERLHRLFSKTP